MKNEFITTFLVICGGIITIGSATANIVKLWNWYKRPSDTNTERIKKIEDKQDEDYKRLVKFDEELNIIMRTQLALLEHEINGNSVEKLQRCKQEIIDYLVGA